MPRKPETKTGRKRGTLVRYARNLGNQDFTRRDLPFSSKQSQLLLRYLWLRGETTKIQEATLGRYGNPAVYRLKQMKLV